MSELDVRLRARANPPVLDAVLPTPGGEGGEEAVAATGQSERRASDEIEAPLPGVVPASDDEAEDELPPVEELVKRLRPEVLATLDELFRARWTDVKRVQQGALKTDQG